MHALLEQGPQPLHLLLAPARREPPIDLDLPAIASRADLLAALTAIAEAAASGALTASQSAVLSKMLIELRQATR